MTTVAEFATSTYTFPAIDSVSFTMPNGSKALVRVNRGSASGPVVFQVVVSTSQTFGPFLVGDVLNVFAQRGSCTYDVVDQEGDQYPYAAASLTASQVAATQALVSGDWKLNAITTLGDSRLAQCWYGAAPVTGQPRAAGYNFLPLARALSMGRIELRPECSFAVSGLRSDEYATEAKVSAALATDSFWLLTGGTMNDIDQRSDTEDYWSLYIKPAVDRWTATGRKAIIMTETGGTGMAGNAAKIKAIARYNSAVRRYCALRPSCCLLLDVSELARAPGSSMAFRANWSGDGVHVNLMQGSYQLAQALVALLDKWLPDQNFLPVTIDDAYANGAYQWAPNPLWVTTTGGTGGTGVTGTIPAGITGWAGDAVVTCAVSTAAGTYGNDLVLAFTASAAGVMRFTMDLTAVGVENAGDIFRLVAETEVDTGHAALSGLPQLRLQYSRDGVSGYSCAAELQGAGFGAMAAGKIGPVVLDTGDVTIPPGVRNWMSCDMQIRFNGAGSATVRVRRLGVVRVKAA
jgi:hypothetical protein